MYGLEFMFNFFLNALAGFLTNIYPMSILFLVSHLQLILC